MVLANTDPERKRIVIQRVSQLPTLPTTLVKILQAAENPSTSSGDIALVISKDQSISSMVLKLVNSAFYGHFRNISSISHAIVILGMQTVKSLALGATIFRTQPGAGVAAFDRNAFWIHSIGVATMARRLMTKGAEAPGVDKETVFVSGLLHDLGKVVFDNYFNEEYREAARQAEEKKITIREAERLLLGLDHCEAGRFLAQKWQFPAPVLEAIELHHDMERAAAAGARVAALAHIADSGCQKINLGKSGNGKPSALDPRALEILNIPESLMAETFSEIEGEKEMIEGFGID